VIQTKARVRNIILLLLVGMALTVPPTAHAQRAANDGATVDGGGLPTPDEIASHVQTVATSKAIIDRILSANQNAPHIASMDFVASLRVRRPLSALPDCVFEGAVKLQEGHRSATVNHLTPGLLCLAINRTIISKLFEGNEPFATLLARFDFQVLGEKVVGDNQSYLVQGKARDSQADPRAMIGWIDYNRGLVIEATMHYAVRTIDLAQHYTSVNGAWVLTYQYVDIPSLGSTLEISYSKIMLESSVPASRVPAEVQSEGSPSRMPLMGSKIGYWFCRRSTSPPRNPA
jgi:hypothetical protein